MINRVALGVGQAERSALNEVSELYGGECIEFSGDRISKNFYWHPVAVVKTGAIEDPLIAARALRATIRHCVHAWCSCYDGILHRLSGGLDSSIVLTALASSPSRTRIAAVTYYMPNGPSDERPYARPVTRRVSCEHVEHLRNPRSVSFTDLLRIAPSVNPEFSYSCLELSRLEAELARKHDATAICTGHGGDAHFGSTARMEVANDHAWHHGLSANLFKVALDAAPMMGLSVWSILAAAVRDSVVGRDADPLKQQQLSFRKLLSADVLHAVTARRACPHPWYHSFNEIPRGTAILIMSLAHSWDFYDPLSSPREARPEPLHPLISQPIAELCLRMPSYILNERGLDRGLARRAFLPDVPHEVLRRRWKDHGVGYADVMFMSNIGIVRELLLDGMLVKEHLLDRNRLETSLRSLLVNKQADSSAGEICSYLVAEVWLRSWANRCVRA